ncbi:hypothetical protein [Aquimarina sp. AU474]|uniref:hypothetical protein n=1 Tax=Aquimarina sp. AU474 TaxID=2108529 RepID=UPI00135B8D96|nr:hypothetical protein [Aquimarina sp. AU474]
MKKKSLNSKTLSLKKIKVSKLINLNIVKGGFPGGTASIYPANVCPSDQFASCSFHNQK